MAQATKGPQIPGHRADRSGMDGWRHVAPAALVGLAAGLSAVFVSQGAPFGSPLPGGWGDLHTAGSMTLMSGLVCALVVVAIVAPGWQRRGDELRLLVGALLIASGYAMVAGLCTVSGAPETGAVATLLGLPVAFATLAPALGCGRSFSTVAVGAGRPRRVLAVAVASSIVLWGVLIAAQPSVGAAALAWVRGTAFVTLAVLGALVVQRHLWLWRIGRHRASMATIGAITAVSGSWWLVNVTAPASAGWWVAHLADLSSVVVLAWAVARHPADRAVAALFEPVTNRDPAIALELGLDPVVRGFVASLERKDPQTRAHVARTAELAIRAAVRAGLPAETIRVVGLGGLLHDIGKVTIPTEILTKPGRLDPAERAVIERHAAAGADLLSGSPSLATVAPVVRWHHERFDGGGYPDGLAGSELPLEAAIVSACDAWDAMTWSRHYRGAMSHHDALEILETGAGTQWAPRAVSLVVAEVSSWDDPSTVAPSVFARTGTEPGDATCDLCCGLEALEATTPA